MSRLYEDTGEPGVSRHFYYTESWQVLEERVDGTSGADVERQFVWGLGYVDKLIVRYRDTTGDATLDETHYVVCDTNYRITALVTTAGGIAERYAYSPYGQRTFLNDDWSLHSASTFGSFEFRYGHQGLRHDPETGLIYNRNRMLHVNLGRFVQRDPVGYADGVALYQYQQSAPVVYRDATGLLTERFRNWFHCRDECGPLHYPQNMYVRNLRLRPALRKTDPATIDLLSEVVDALPIIRHPLSGYPVLKEPIMEALPQLEDGLKEMEGVVIWVQMTADCCELIGGCCGGGRRFVVRQRNGDFIRCSASGYGRSIGFDHDDHAGIAAAVAGCINEAASRFSCP